MHTSASTQSPGFANRDENPRSLLRARLLGAALLFLATHPGSAQQPGNDQFGAAFTISESTGSTTGASLGATFQAGEPDHAGEPAVASVWWRWTAPENGTVRFDTFGSEFDTILAVYTGSSLADLVTVAENDDAGEDYQSLVAFRAAAGTTYWIVVDGYDGETGEVFLNWGPGPENDLFDGAIELIGAQGNTVGTNQDASAETGEPHREGDRPWATVWWTWTAPQDGLVVFDTFGSDFDTILVVYTGSQLDELVLVESNDDSGDDLQSRVSFEAGAGESFRIAVDGYDGEMGNILLNWSSGPPDEGLRIEELSVLPGGAFRFVVRGPADTVGIVERSTDGEDWDEWVPFELAGGEEEIIDEEAGSRPEQLYRAVVP